DAKAYAIAVRDALEAAFGEETVFLDRDALVAGAWAPQLEVGITSCRVFVVVIGRGWLDACDVRGGRRLDDAQDVHRQEVALALQTRGVTVLPLLVDGAALPAADDLPTPLRPLAAQQAYTWNDSARHRAADRARLLAAIERLAGLHAAAPVAQGGGWLAPTAAALVLTAIAAIASSMASLGLGPVEFVIVLAIALCATFGARSLWQHVRIHA
nr:TIR domain-containing protein [Caldimonas sp.]